ncbi:biliverdin-producing heme oxygenase [Caulobacter mirabilis]|uniref:Biliverdin-producing heme oxygenase n=1 Tax=Caulobacter mirabilis TaxID=69666 RepID=A0A2D2AY88_9CAUL|nr:biliverdin-producing heme oxygenase [Caulobacter mirabilis]ATQ42955.1 biliverdin-producing heme oxygenase [Caulobacter mirabilis]
MTEVLDPSRARRLKALTHAVHERLDGSIMAAASFDTVKGYGRFVTAQALFHHDIAALYDDESLQALLPGLVERRRIQLIMRDLADLDLEDPIGATTPTFRPDRPIDTPTALGWLYVAEGSNLGAAVLRKQAAKLGLADTHGARHLAPAEDGPAAYWRRFTEALDAVDLDAAAEARVVAGAEAAFARMQSHVDHHLG